MKSRSLVVQALAILSVIFVAGCPKGPQMEINKSILRFDQEDVMSGDTMEFTISNTGGTGSTLDFLINADADWITVSPDAGSVTAGDEPATIMVTITPSKADFNTGTVTITSTNTGVDAQSVTVTAAPDFFTELFMGDFDLDNTSLIFSEDAGSLDYYEGTKSAITELPTDPDMGGGFVLDLDFELADPISIGLFNNQTVSLYGMEFDTLIVDSNGHVSFGPPETAKGALTTLEDHFSEPRITGLAPEDGLDPTSGGLVSFKQTNDRAVVTFEGVPVTGTVDTNTFQMEMLFDGTVRLSYLDVDVDDAIVGLSFGDGLPENDPFIETDLSAFNTGSLKTGF